MAAKGKRKQLTLKQQKFVEHYVANQGNASKAALAAGYSKASAYSTACDNLKKPEIVEAIRQARQNDVEKIDVKRQDVVTGWAGIAFADIREVWTDDDGTPRLKPMSEWPANVARAVQSVKITPTRYGDAMQVTLAPKLGALDSLAKYLRMFVDEEGNPLDGQTLVVNIG